MPNQDDTLRRDGTKKGLGFFGPLRGKDGRDMTEFTVGVELDGKETDIPTFVPGLTKEELDLLLGGGEPTDEIVQKAVDHAKKRLKEGKSVFAEPDEKVDLPKGFNPPAKQEDVAKRLFPNFN